MQSNKMSETNACYVSTVHQQSRKWRKSDERGEANAPVQIASQLVHAAVVNVERSSSGPESTTVAHSSSDSESDSALDSPRSSSAGKARGIDPNHHSSANAPLS